MDLMYKVCIRCYTYNQAQYIEDTMNGFVMQETNFPFVVAIVDDASTDNEPQIILSFLNKYFDRDDSSLAFREEADYGTLFFAKHKTNLNCYFAVVLLKENHRSQKKNKRSYISRWLNDVPFVALCEGDDYWTDPLKLQTQVDFLEGHEDYSLCCHRYKIYNQNSDIWEEDYTKHLFEIFPDGFTFTRTDNLNTWITKTVSLVYRQGMVNQEDLKKYRFRCDEHLNYHLLSSGPGYCYPFVGAVYRRTNAGVFAPLSKREKGIRGVLIRSDLLEFNLKDGDLRDNVLRRIRKYIYEYHSFSGIMRPISICIKSVFVTDGWKESVRSSKKILSSYVKGLCHK